MRSLLLASLLGLVATACATTSATTSSPSSSAEEAAAVVSGKQVVPLRFAWPVPSRVQVTQDSTKKGKQFVSQYDAVLTERADGEGYALRLENFRFVSFEGKDLTKGPLPKELAAAQAMASAIPELHVSREGAVTDIVGMEQTIERVIATLPEDKKLREQMRAVLASPQMAAAMKTGGAEFWQVWVEAWKDLEVATGDTLTGEIAFPLPNGEQAPGKVTVRHLGADAEAPDHVRLEMETEAYGEPLRRAMRSMVADMVRSMGTDAKAQEADKALEAIKDVRRVARLSVVTDPATLRPRSARSEEITTVVMGNGHSETRRDQTSYTFRWPAP